MPKDVTAKNGDTLCGIGIDNGFLDCAPIRKANGGKDFLSRPLKAPWNGVTSCQCLRPKTLAAARSSPRRT